MKAILQWVLKTMMKDQTGIVRTMPKKDLVDFNVAMTAERLMRNGIDPNSLKNANQVENAINQIEAPRNVNTGIRQTESAKIMDMEGKEIDPRSKIMGGKQSETEAEIAERLSRENKESAARIKNKKIVKDAIDNASPGFVKGDRKYNAQLVAEDLADKKFGKEFYDLDQRQQMDLYSEALDGLDDLDKFAQGGRAGFSKGSGLKTLFNFLNENNPLQAYKKYLKSVENRMKAGKELEVAGEVVPIAAGGALVTNQMKKVLKKMNEDQKKRIEQEAQEELRKDMEKKAQGGRAGFANGTGAPSITLGPKDEPMGPMFETNDPEEAAKEVIRRLITVEGAQIPLTREGLLSLNIDSLDKQSLGGIIDLLGGELQFGVGRDKEGKGAGFTFRKQFKDGSGMTRRTFLKILGGAMSIPIIGKFLKPFKTAKGVTKVPMIKTDDVPGKPEWFDALVNKVIVEGDDVTKKFATAERQSIHQKTLDDGSVVRVTEDVDDGAVRVEYESKESMFGEPVQMEYKKPLPDEGDPRPAAEFEVSESGIVSRADGPDDFVLEPEGVSGTSIRDLDSDVSALKQYATGKGPTMKEIVEIKKRKDKVKRLNEGDSSETSQYISDRQGDYDPSPDDFASGGIARMLGE